MVVAAPDDVGVSRRRSCSVLATEGSGDGDSFFLETGAIRPRAPQSAMKALFTRVPTASRICQTDVSLP